MQANLGIGLRVACEKRTQVTRGMNHTQDLRRFRTGFVDQQVGERNQRPESRMRSVQLGMLAPYEGPISDRASRISNRLT